MSYDDFLDVWSLQYTYEEINECLKGWKNEDENTIGDTILFSNVDCQFILGGKSYLTKQWDAFLYSEANDKLIMLMRNGAVSVDCLRRELDIRGIIYHEVIFTNNNDKNYKDNTDLPEFWTARDIIVLDEFVKDSANKNSNTGVYYPLVTGLIELSYKTNDEITKIKVEGRIINGVIEMDDKIILLLKTRNGLLHHDDVISVLDSNNISYEINYDNTYIPKIKSNVVESQANIR